MDAPIARGIGLSIVALYLKPDIFNITGLASTGFDRLRTLRLWHVSHARLCFAMASSLSSDLAQ
jgi:hypothetical protein